MSPLHIFIGVHHSKCWEFSWQWSTETKPWDGLMVNPSRSRMIATQVCICTTVSGPVSVPKLKFVRTLKNCKHALYMVSTFNPLTTEFFPPRPHIFMHSAHTTFVGTPLPQHSLLSGQTWWGPHTCRDPSGNTVNDIHDPPQAQQSEVKGGCWPDFRPAFP